MRALKKDGTLFSQTDRGLCSLDNNKFTENLVIITERDYILALFALRYVDLREKDLEATHVAFKLQGDVFITELEQFKFGNLTDCHRIKLRCTQCDAQLYDCDCEDSLLEWDVVEGSDINLGFISDLLGRENHETIRKMVYGAKLYPFDYTGEFH